MKSIAIIGQGVWGKKLTESIQKSSIRNQVESMSSRAFLSNTPKRTFDVIWIAGRPDSQAETLEIAQSVSKLVILEKPLGATLNDFLRVEELIKSANCNIGLSMPWCFSNIWLNLLERIKCWDLKGASLTFQRCGPVAHSNISPIEDWMPHDIYLASDILPSYEEHASVRLIKKTLGECVISLELENDITLNFEFKVSSLKESKLELITSSSTANVDFLNKKLLINGEASEVSIPNSRDGINRNLLAAINGEVSRTIQSVRTQTWMKVLIDSA
jgi:predicted dehydrogenase